MRTRGYAYGHGKHSFTCSCGKTVSGNGGKASHRAMHDRKGDDVRWLSSSEAYQLRAAAYEEGNGA